MVNLLAIVGLSSLVDIVVLDYHPRVKEGVMSDEDLARAKEGPVQQEVVVGTENNIGKEPGLVDAQKQVDFSLLVAGCP